MQTVSEEEAKEKLGIDSWKNISKEKVIEFGAMMPEMDKEVVLKIVEQFPEFTKFAGEVVDSMEEMYKATVKANADSQDEVLNAYKEIRVILKDELGRNDDYSPEERIHILNMIMETGEKESKKDSENKEFLFGLFKTAGKIAGGIAGGVIVVAALIFVGSKDSK